MKVLYLIHTYQPPYQTENILLRVVAECYSKIFNIIDSSPKGKIVLNINGSLSELLHRYGFGKILKEIRKAADDGKIEFTGSAAYHPILPLLPEDEIIRQIKLNDSINKRLIGEIYKPVGFWCPEMCYSSRIGEIICEAGFKWTIVDEIAFNGTVGSYPKSCIFKDGDLTIFLRNRDISSALAFSMWRKKDIHTSDELKKLINEYTAGDDFLCLATDGEVFGHHKRNRENLLSETLNDNDIELCGFSDVISHISKSEKLVPKESSWSSKEFELQKKIPFSLWNDPENELHTLQWDFLQLGLEVLRQNSEDGKLRTLFDKCLSSDQFFWASCRPWWDGRMVEEGAKILHDTILSARNIREGQREKAMKVYKNILEIVAEWNKKGIARVKRIEFLRKSGVPEDRVRKVLM